MHNIPSSLLADYVMLWSLIDAAEVDQEDSNEDEIILTRTASGEYSAKSAYDIQFDGSLISSFPKMVWRVWAPSRCKVFTWLMLQNKIWTVDRLLLKEWPNDYFCPLCRRNLETVVHLFQECLVVRQVWMETSN
jgi:hypothetical protein